MSLLEILCSSRSLCVFCVLWFLHVFFHFEGLWWKFFGALEAWIYRASLICGLLRFLEAFKLWFQWPLRSRQVVWMILLRMFFVFEGSWRKFFGVLEVWISRASLICGLLRFLKAFKLDSSDFWDLGRWFGWFLFECFSNSKLKFLKFLEASRLGSDKVSGLLNLGLLQLSSNVLEMLLFIGV